MKMFRIITAAFASLVLVSSPVLAQDIQSQGLTEIQRAELQRQAAQMREQNGVPQPSTAAKTKEWIEVGSAVGEGLASAAERAGVVVNDFAKTPVGQLTMWLIIYKVAGGDIIQLGIGLIFGLVTFTMWARSLLSVTSKHVEITYNEKGKRIQRIERPSDWVHDDGKTFVVTIHWVLFFVLAIMNCIIIFA